MLAPTQLQLQHHLCVTARQSLIKLSQQASAQPKHSQTLWETKHSKHSALFKYLFRYSKIRNATARDQVYLVSQPFNVHLVVLQQVSTRLLPFKIISVTVLMQLILTTEPTFPVYAKMLLSARTQKVFLLKLHLLPITFLAI